MNEQAARQVQQDDDAEPNGWKLTSMELENTSYHLELETPEGDSQIVWAQTKDLHNQLNRVRYKILATLGLVNAQFL